MEQALETARPDADMIEKQLAEIRYNHQVLDSAKQSRNQAPVRAEDFAEANSEASGPFLTEGEKLAAEVRNKATVDEQSAQMEKLESALKVMEDEATKLETEIAGLEALNQETQVKVDQGGPSASIHQRVIEVRKGEVVDKKKKLEAKKLELNNTKEFINLSRPEQLQ